MPSESSVDGVLYELLHDLRTPVRHIKQYAHFATANPGALPDDLAHKIHVISHSAASLDRMVDNLFALCRTSIQADGFAEVELETVVQQAILHLRLEIQDRNAMVVFGSLPKVRGIDGLLVSALQNLILNGLKFNRSHKPFVQVSGDVRQGRPTVVIADNGVGIPEEDRQHVFEAGRQLNHCGAVDGSGVGLAIVKRIVDFHGAEIWVEANPGGGTCICIAFLPSAD